MIIFQRSLLSPRWRRRFYSLLGAPLNMMSILSQFYFLMGKEAGDLVVWRTCTSFPVGVCSLRWIHQNCFRITSPQRILLLCRHPCDSHVHVLLGPDFLRDEELGHQTAPAAEEEELVRWFELQSHNIFFKLCGIFMECLQGVL